MISLLEQGKKIIILGQVPRMVGLDRKCEMKAAEVRFVDCQSQSLPVEDIVYESNKILKELAYELDDGYYFDTHKYLCKAGRCSAYLDEKLLYFDSGHLNMDGSWLVGDNIIKNEGVPVAFQHLKNVGGVAELHDGRLREWLNKRTENKFNALEESGEELLGEPPLNEWKGNAEVRRISRDDEIDQFIASDISAGKFQLISHMFPMSSDLVIEKKLNKFLVSIDLFATDVMPFMRLSTIGKRKASYDLIFNADESYAKAKRAAKADDIFVKSLGGNRFKLYAVIDLEGGMTGV